MKILREQLVEMLTAEKGAKIVTLYTKVSPKMKKRGNPYLGLLKKSKINGVVNFNYENSVNRQRVREESEADFKAEIRKWGTKIPGTCIVEHNGKYYLEVKVENVYDTKYIVGNQEIEKEKVKPYLYDSSGNPRQDLDKEVILRDYSLDSIEAIKYGGKLYDVVESLPSIKEYVGV